MCFIFDSFPSHRDADRFVTALAKKHGVLAGVYDSQDISDHVDPAMFELTPPVVLVSQTPAISWHAEPRQEQLEKLARRFGGLYAGT